MSQTQTDLLQKMAMPANPVELLIQHMCRQRRLLAVGRNDLGKAACSPGLEESAEPSVSANERLERSLARPAGFEIVEAHIDQLVEAKRKARCLLHAPNTN